MSVSSNSLFLGSGLYFFYIHLLQLSLSLASVLPKLGFFFILQCRRGPFVGKVEGLSSMVVS
jgi:hypothetical protein